METKKSYSIREISRLLNIPKATIRYWDSQGLLTPERNEENDYREYSLPLAMELSNISFYRSVDIPVKELRQMLNSDLTVQEDILQEARQRLFEKEAQLKRQAERIQLQLQALGEVKRLGETPIEKKASVPVFEKAAAFSHLQEEHWQKIIEQPWSFVLVFEEGQEKKCRYGIGYGPGEKPAQGEELIWEALESPYLEGLLIADNRDESRNNLAKQREKYHEQGIQTGRVMAQYLTSGVKGQKDIWDYYRMWLEIK